MDKLRDGGADGRDRMSPLEGILSGVSVASTFTALAGFGGCVDLDEVTFGALAWCAGLLALGGAAGIAAWRESGKGRRNGT